MGLKELSDGQLLRQFLGTGSQRPFQVLFERHAQAVLRVCQRAVGGVGEAEDVLQMVFLTLARKADALSGSRSVLGWLYRTAWNIGMRQRRDMQTRQKHEQRAAELAPAVHHPEPVDPVEPLLMAAIADLNDDFRDVIVLHYFQGLTVEETAQVLAYQPGTVASRLSRGREVLRQRLRAMGIALSLPAIIASLAVMAASRTAGATTAALTGVMKNLGRAMLNVGAVTRRVVVGGTVVFGPAVVAGTAVGGAGYAGALVTKGVASVGAVAGGTAIAAGAALSVPSFLKCVGIAVLGCAVAAAAISQASTGGPDAVKSTTSASDSSGPSASSSEEYSSGGASVPEPSALGLLGLAGGLLLRRRGRQANTH